MSEMTERNGAANVRVVQPPERPATGTSLRKIIVVVGIVAGAIAALATVAVLNALRQVFVSARDVVEALNLPVLAAIDDLDAPRARPSARPARARTRSGTLLQHPAGP
jgi:capsular polysaccharide biosynthesis protein